MGDEAQARREYEKAIHEAPSNGAKAEYLQKQALTYVRERRYAEADVAYRNAAAKARAMEQWIWEARAHRVMAMYEPDQAAALKNLDAAESLLAAASGRVAQLELDEEKAQALRVRVERALAGEDFIAAGKFVKKLEKMATPASSVNTKRIHHGAAGTLLVAQMKYADAIAELEEDPANPLSMKLLITAYRKTGAADDAASLSKKLQGWKVPSVEEALAGSDGAEGAQAAAKN